MRLKVLSYNIHKCIGGVDRKYQPDRIVEVITKQDADVVMLQEVDAGVTRSNGDKQAEVLADKLGMKYWSWFPNVDVRGGGQYGNAILARYPLIETSNIDLSIRFKKKRSPPWIGWRVGTLNRRFRQSFTRNRIKAGAIRLTHRLKRKR